MFHVNIHSCEQPKNLFLTIRMILNVNKMGFPLVISVVIHVLLKWRRNVVLEIKLIVSTIKIKMAIQLISFNALTDSIQQPCQYNEENGASCTFILTLVFFILLPKVASYEYRFIQVKQTQKLEDTVNHLLLGLFRLTA